MQMHLAGHGRNEIARLLNEQGLRVSEGSVGNIVRTYRRSRNEQSLQSDMNNTSEIEQVTTNIATPRNGAPLSHLLGEDTSTDEEEIISVSVTPYSNSPSPVVPGPNTSKTISGTEIQRFIHKRSRFSRCSRRGI